MLSLEAIVLRVTPLAERSFLLHILSRSHGILTISRKARLHEAALSPLLKVEAQVIPASKEILRCQELTILTAYPHLRDNLRRLRVACGLLASLAKYLPHGQPAVGYYDLLDSHLMRLHECTPPEGGAASFWLKVLLAEGALPPQDQQLVQLAHTPLEEIVAAHLDTVVVERALRLI